MRSKFILKLIATGLFVFAMAFGASTSMIVSESGINSLSMQVQALSSQSAQGEWTSTDDKYYQNDDCWSADNHRCYINN